MDFPAGRKSMSERLTDDDLIFLVQQKTPEELTLEELTQLRERLRESADLRAALDGTLFIESRLNRVLSEVQIPVDSILKRARELEQKASPRIPRWAIWMGLATMLVTVGASIFLVTRARQNAPLDPEQDVVATDPSNGGELRESGKSPFPLTARTNSQDSTGKNDPTANPGGGAPNSAGDILSDAHVVEAPRPPDWTNANATTTRTSISPWAAELDLKHPPLPLSSTMYRSISRTFPLSSAEMTAARRRRGARRPVPQQKAEPVFGNEHPAGDDPVATRSTNGMGSEPISLALLQEALAPVPGKPLKLFETEAEGRRLAGFEGIGRLQVEWPTDGVLRLALVDPLRFRMHFWTGKMGVTAQFHEQGRPAVWGVHRGQRSGNEPLPVKLALETTDDARHFRGGLGLFEVRWQKGELLLTRGDIRLLSVPLASPPTEIFFEGRASLSLLTMFRGEPFPSANPNPRRIVLRSERPAELRWIRDVETDDEFQASGDGRVSLSIPAATIDKMSGRMLRPERWAGTSLGKPGLYEVIVRVDEADPGTGIYLGSLEGEPIHHIGFFRDRKTQQTTFGFGWTRKGYVMSPNIRIDVDEESQSWPAAWAGQPQWLRIVVGLQGVSIWSSGDGIHWGRTERAVSRQGSGSFATVGLYALAGDKPRHIRLGYVEVRELTSLRSLAREDLRRKVALPAEVDKLDFGGWFEHLLRTRPAGADLEAWRTASAVQTLESDPPPQLAMQLLEGLLEAGLRQKKPPRERLDLLDEVALLVDDGQPSARLNLAGRYEELSDLLHAERAPLPYRSSLSRRLESSPPLGAAHTPTSASLSATFVQTALLATVSSHDWAEARLLAERFEFWMEPALPVTRTGPVETKIRDLIAWTELLAAARAAGEKTAGPDHAPQLRQPLAARLNRDAFNVMAEFESAIAGRSFKDAARIISSTATTSAQGLVPDARDPQLLVSFPRAVAGAMRDHPQLLTTMKEEFGRVGTLRVRQALADAQVETVEALTVQFHGTEAAAEAHSWLGDRWMAVGKFGQAIEHYLTARRGHSNTTSRSDLDARIRLASALLGIAPPPLDPDPTSATEFDPKRTSPPATPQPSPTPAGKTVVPMPTGPVTFGGQTLPASDFEALLKEILSGKGVPTPTLATTASPGKISVSLPAPVAHRGEVRLAWEIASTGPLSTSPPESRAGPFRLPRNRSPRTIVHSMPCAALSILTGFMCVGYGGFLPATKSSPNCWESTKPPAKSSGHSPGLTTFSPRIRC